MLCNIWYKCPVCGFEFSVCFDPDECTEEEIEEIESCPCGYRMMRVSREM